MKTNNSHKIFFFSLIGLILLVPNFDNAYAINPPVLEYSNSNNTENASSCTVDALVTASDDLIVVVVYTDDSNGISVSDEDTQTYTLQTDSTASGTGPNRCRKVEDK